MEMHSTSSLVKDRIIEMIVNSNDPISMFDVYEQFQGIPQGTVSAVITRLVVETKDIKRSVFNGVKYIRASDAPLPDGHVDKGHERIVVKMTKADREAERLEKEKE